MCHYAWVLIEINMTKGCEDFIMLEMKELVLFASIKYEHLPSFAVTMVLWGHSIEHCRSVRRRNVDGQEGVTSEGPRK